MIRLKMIAIVCAMIQLGFIVLGIFILQHPPYSDFIKYTCYFLIPFNGIMMIINLHSFLS